MGRPIRLLAPGTTWFVSARCIDARFLLRPDSELNTVLGFCLARACQRHPAIKLYGFVALSNHLHILLTDDNSMLSSFMEYFLGTLAKSVNVLRDRRGHVFERRFSAEPILDPVALHERWLYLVLNPVRAGLVARHEQWPGLCLQTADSTPRRYRFRRFCNDGYEKARRATPKGHPRPAPKEFYEEQTVSILPLPQNSTLPHPSPPIGTLRAELRRREQRIGEERQRQGFLGPKRVLAQHPLAAPQHPKRSPRPLCHTVILALHKQYRMMIRALEQAYAAASAAYRRGAFQTEFPRFTCRPPVPLLVPS